jgi:hypothetical protein
MSSELRFLTHCSHDQLIPLLAMIESLYEQNAGPWSLTVYTPSDLVARVLHQIPKPELQGIVVTPTNLETDEPRALLTKHRALNPESTLLYVAPELYFFDAPWEAIHEKNLCWRRDQTIVFRVLQAHQTLEDPTQPVSSGRWLTADTLPTGPFTSVADGCIEGPDGLIQAIDYHSFVLLQSDSVACPVENDAPFQDVMAVVMPYARQLQRAWVWLASEDKTYHFFGPPPLIKPGSALFCYGSAFAQAQSRFERPWVQLPQGWRAQWPNESLTVESVDPAWPCPANRHYARRTHSEQITDVVVTAIVSTYNAGDFISGCMESLVQQSLFQKGQLEIVVIDSASEHGEQEVVAHFMAQHPNISYFRTHEREGLYQAWNRGVDVARGRYLTNANTDDRHHPTGIERMANYLDTHPGKGVVYGQTLITQHPNQSWADRAPNSYISVPAPNQATLARVNTVGPQPMWRKALHAQAGFFDSRYVVAGDYEMWLRFAECTHIGKLEEVVGLYLDRPDSVEHANADRCIAETQALIWSWRHWRTNETA